MTSIELVKNHCAGRWPEIHSTVAPILDDLIQRGIKHGPCPLCGGKDRARCFNDYPETGGIFCNQCGGGWDGIEVIRWANDWNFYQTITAVRKYFGHAGVENKKPYPPAIKVKKEDWTRKRNEQSQIWSESVTDPGPIADYLQYRGLSVSVPDSLRFHKNLTHYNNGRTRVFPAMVALIQRGDAIVGMQKTFLDRNGLGKASVDSPKKSPKCADTLSGGAVRLFDLEPDKPLLLVEGIETGLAVHQMTGMPVWACLSATMLAKVQVPATVKEVIVGGDLDHNETGQKAAEQLAARLCAEGRIVKFSFPPGPIPDGKRSIDWLDVLSQEVIYG